MEEHNNYALDFIEATRWIKHHLPRAKVSGGISNVSFSFRGNNAVREAMHAAFLYHAIQAGLDMGIVNAGMLGIYEEIPKDLLELVEDVLLNRRPDATERLVKFAETVKQKDKTGEVEDEWRKGTVEQRLQHALVKGIVDFIEIDTEEARQEYRPPAGRHRRAAHGGHERGGRSVWLGQNVPAAGGQERARDEESRRLAAPFHGRGKARNRARPRAGQNPAGHRQGRRA